MNKVLIIAKREFLNKVMSWTFWLATLSFPLIFVGITAISVLGSSSIENIESVNFGNLEEELVIVDQSGLISLPEDRPELVTFNPDNRSKEELVEQTRLAEIGGLIYYPENILQDKVIEIYAEDRGIIANDRYSGLAQSLLNRSIVNQIESDQIREAINASFSTSVTSYKDGEVSEISFLNLIIPIASLILYMTWVMSSSQFMLQSVAEEKENRMIEIVLTNMKPYELIIGKLIGTSGILFMQVLAILASALIPLLATVTFFAIQFPFSLSDVSFTIIQLLLSLLMVVVGFLTMSAIMVGVAAVAPNYKDAQNFAGIFIFLSITPTIFFGLIMADPDNFIAQVLSFVPLSGPLAIVLRNGLDSIGGLELVLAVAVNILYLYLSLVFAFRLFKVGALQFNQRMSTKKMISTMLRG